MKHYAIYSKKRNLLFSHCLKEEKAEKILYDLINKSNLLDFEILVFDNDEKYRKFVLDRIINE